METAMGTATPAPPGARPPLNLSAILQYAYLLRVPLIAAISLFGLPIVSLFWARQLLGNLFVLDPWSIFWTVLAAFVLAWGVLVEWRVVLLNGQERFGTSQALTRDVITPRALLLSELLTVPMVGAAVFSNGQAGSMSAIALRLGTACAAVFTAHVAGFLALLLSVLVSPRYSVSADKRFPVPSDWMRTLLERAYDSNFKWDIKADEKWPEFIKAGYFDRHTRLLYPGQWLSLFMLLFTMALYVVIGLLRQVQVGGESGAPAVAYVLLLLMLLNWGLAMLTFFLDRFRVPLLLPVLFVLYLVNFPFQLDHYYSIVPGAGGALADPARVLTASRRVAPDSAHPRGRVVVVATAGGGIQAAAWTAQVLTGLENELRGPAHGTAVNFADSIAVISSVSGGAVGTMFFVNRYKTGPGGAGFPAPDLALPSVLDLAERPSLNEVAWATVYVDFWRIFFPILNRGRDELQDRGWALEESWRTRAGINGSLGEWRQGLEEGLRPAVIFNATIVETGEPLLFATTALPENHLSGARLRAFTDLFREGDIPIVTAVRLAATFPYVTPAARAKSDKISDHVVDGGYYDNYGVSSLLAWLKEALESTPAEQRPDILLIQIRSFPGESDKELEAPKNRDWFFQTWAPIKALMRTRTSGQLIRDREAVGRFVDLWAARGVGIWPATFEFQGGDAPLSWKMNADQIRTIGEEWHDRIYGTPQKPKDNQDWLQVSCFFHPKGEDCKELATFGKKHFW